MPILTNKGGEYEKKRKIKGVKVEDLLKKMKSILNTLPKVGTWLKSLIKLNQFMKKQQ